MYSKTLPNGIEIRSTRAEDAEQLEQLQIIVFPTLADSQRLKAAHYKKHIEIFPDGQFVAVDNGKIVGMTTSIRLSDKYLNSPHSFDQIICGGFCTSHDENGEWLYGVDMGTHPEYRGKGLAKGLYAARQQTVNKFGLYGQCTMGMLSGYGAMKGTISAEDYYTKMLKGEIFDPTVSTQIKMGFEAKGLVPDYLEDPVCGNYCVRLVLAADKFK